MTRNLLLNSLKKDNRISDEYKKLEEKYDNETDYLKNIIYKDMKINNKNKSLIYIKKALVNSNNNFNSKSEAMKENSRITHINKESKESNNSKNLIKVKDNKQESNKGLINKKYDYYIFAMKQLDNVKDKGINYFEYDHNITNNLSNKNQTIRIIKVFNKQDEKKKKIKLSITREYVKQNILEEHVNNIKSRKLSNNLLKPHYFFTARYNEKSMPTQIKHWTSSIYSFLKTEKAGNNFLDIYTSKLINLFFSVKYIKRKLVWNVKLIEGFKVIPNTSLIKDINTIISYTSNRTSLVLRKMTSFTPLILTIDWVKKQLKLSSSVSRIIRQRKLDIFTGYYPKKKSYMRKLSRVLLSKPLFKHTSFNLIIDLFIYNNKKYKFRMLKNIVIRRSIYKYMYSMYIESYQKIKETINRPRFFYINLIDPGVHNYYKWVTYYYEAFLIRKKRSLFIYLCLLLLQLNFIRKNTISLNQNKINKNIIVKEKENTDIYNEINLNVSVNNVNTNVNIYDNNKDNEFINKKSSFKSPIISYKSLIRRNKYSNKLSYYLPYLKSKKTLKLYNMNKILLDKIKSEIDMDDKKTVNKIFKERESKLNEYKKYLEVLKWRSDNPIDLNSLTLWNTEGLGNKNNSSTGIVVKEKRFKNDKRKYSYNSYKEKLKQDQLIKDILKGKGSFKQKKEKISKIKAENTKKFMKKFNLTTMEELSLFNKARSLKKNSNSKESLKLTEFLKEKYDFFYSHNKMRKNYLYREKKRRVSEKESIIYSNNINLSNKLLKSKKKDKIYNENINRNEKRKIATQVNVDSIDSLALSKEKYIKEIYLNKKNIYNKLFTSFYINTENKKDYSYQQNNKMLDSLGLGSSISYSSFVGEYRDKINMNSILRIEKLEKLSNSKVIWDNLDYSILRLLSKFLKLNLKGEVIKPSHLSSTFNQITKFKGFGNIWYIIYFMSVIKKEFSLINKDVLISKDYQILPYSNTMANQTYDFFYTEKESEVLNYSSNNKNVNINIWPALFNNKRENSLNFNMGYNEKLFKPYYRYLIPYFIFKSYIRFLSFIKVKKPIFNKNNYILNKLNGLNNNNFVLYNFLTIKILLDLLHYNYRSLIRVKSKYYYMSKLRLFKTKFKKLSINNWVTSIRFIRKLRKTPLNYWLRYHRVASYYFNRIVQNAELDTKRKIFVPFVLYFEDILFNIYGKWVIVRLWPLKRYYLSSFILAGRVLLLILWRKKRQVSKLNFQRITSQLIAGIKILQIKKAYEFYINNSSPWPITLVNKLKNGKSYRSLNYNNLEFFNNIEDRYHSLNTYTLNNNSLSSYLSSLKDQYLTTYINNVNSIRNGKLKTRINKSRINKIEFIYYWLRPLKHYLLELNRSFDISGIRMRITGRAGIRRNNLRSIYKTRFYGSFLGPRHSSIKLLKAKTISAPRIRGYLRSNIDYAFKVSKSKNGSISFKVWMSSEISADIHELLLHLIHIKNLYNELINRYYIVNPYINNINKNYLFKPLKIYKKGNLYKQNKRLILKKV